MFLIKVWALEERLVLNTITFVLSLVKIHPQMSKIWG